MIYEEEWYRNLIGDLFPPSKSKEIWVKSNSVFNHIQRMITSIETQIIYDKPMDKLTALQLGILEFLATQGSSTMYKVKKELNIPFSSLWNAFSILESNGLIRVISKEKWRTGLQRKVYGLTSLGITPILVFHEERVNRKLVISQYQKLQDWFEGKILHSYFRSIRQKYKHIPVYDIFFQNWDLFQNAWKELGSKLSLFTVTGALKFYSDLKDFYTQLVAIYNGKTQLEEKTSLLRFLRRDITSRVLLYSLCCHRKYACSEILETKMILSRVFTTVMALGETSSGRILLEELGSLIYRGLEKIKTELNNELTYVEYTLDFLRDIVYS